MPAEVRRRQILSLAADLFATKGYAGTTTREIAAAAGVSETVLYRHFPTKETLYASILEDRMPVAGVEHWLAELRELADRRDDEALFTAVVTAIIRWHREDGVSHRLMLFAALENHELASIFQLKYTVPVGSFLREYVSRRQAEGAFRPMRPEIVVSTLLSFPSYFAQWSSFGVNPFGLSDADIPKHAETLLDGIRTCS
jgi:TetR/AcrR family transcriptional regulator